MKQSTIIVTGAHGVVGYSVSRLFLDRGWDVVGIDNDHRAALFGRQGSTASIGNLLRSDFPRQYFQEDVDIRDEKAIRSIVHSNKNHLRAVIHAAGQPSHDWSASHVLHDFDVNARATVVLLEAVRQYAKETPFVFMSTNKVYGDAINGITFSELPTRWEFPKEFGYPGSPVHWSGVDESLWIDCSLHSPFGCSKVAADLYVQEYGRYFEMPTVCFRCGCLTGGVHRGVKLHGFLAYLAKTIVEEGVYTVYGYKGKQVRDNLHAADVARAVAHFVDSPGVAQIYNMGGGRENSCSILEAAELISSVRDISPCWEMQFVDEHRVGDHKWWISDTSKFEARYPNWHRQWDLKAIIKELVGVHDV